MSKQQVIVTSPEAIEEIVCNAINKTINNIKKSADIKVFLTKTEVIEKYGIPARQLKVLRDERKIDAKEISKKCILYKKSSIDALLDN